MKSLLPEYERAWILWILEASEREELDFRVIGRILERYSNLTVPIRELTRGGIDFRSSSLVKKLLKQGFLRISTTDFELHPRYLTNRNELSAELKEFYEGYNQFRLPMEKQFPTGAFSNLPDEAQRIPLTDLNTGLLQAAHQPEAIIEISLAKNGLPSILINGEYMQALPLFCWRKIKHHLALFAAENGDFYSDKILVYKNLLIGRPREILEGTLSGLNRRTEKDLREEGTRIIMERIISSGEANRQVLRDLVSSENSYILTRFSYNDRGDFDFLQSLVLLDQLLRAGNRSRRIGPEDYLAAVREAINLTVSQTELTQLAAAAYPEADEQEVRKAFALFRESFVSASSSLPEVLSFSAAGSTELFIHRNSLESYLDSRIGRLRSGISTKLKERWLRMIEQHRFEEAMNGDKAFRELLQNLCAAQQPETAALLQNASLRKLLEEVKASGPFAQHLKDHGYSQTDRLFEMNRTAIYDEIYHTVYSRYTWLKSLIFRLLHWIAWSVFQGQQNNEQKPSPGEPRAASNRGGTEKELLARMGLSKSGETAEALQQLWGKLPADILPREEIDRNILTDLHAFYADHNEVMISSLSLITERNLRRIIRKAAHLEGYSQALNEYIEFKITALIASRPDLRAKTRL
jgi:hypothetical protein